MGEKRLRALSAAAVLAGGVERRCATNNRNPVDLTGRPRAMSGETPTTSTWTTTAMDTTAHDQIMGAAFAPRAPGGAGSRTAASVASRGSLEALRCPWASH